MMELSAKEWVRHKDNSIIVSGFEVCDTSGNTEVLYSNVEYGCNVKCIKRRSISNGKPIHWNEINLSETKGSYFMITKKKRSVQSILPIILYLIHRKGKQSRIKVKISIIHLDLLFYVFVIWNNNAIHRELHMVLIFTMSCVDVKTILLLHIQNILVHQDVIIPSVIKVII